MEGTRESKPEVKNQVLVTFQLVKLVLINPPALLSVMWQIARFIMDKKMQSRIVFLEHPSDLLKHFHPQVSSLCSLEVSSRGCFDPKFHIGFRDLPYLSEGHVTS